MNARTEKLLYEMMWLAGQLMRPTYHSLTESFDDWARRSGLHRRLAELWRQQLLVDRGVSSFSDRRILGLTEAGEAMAQSGLFDPGKRWARAWDGKWRLVLFDVPVERRALRMKLWRFLRSNRFGYLQNSVWVTPDETGALRERMGTVDSQVSSLMLLEARPCGGESDAEIVNEAWNFKAINEGYRSHMKILARMPRAKEGFAVWREWIRQERVAWLRVSKEDPFLPEALLPDGYLGRQAWEQRNKRMRRQ